MRFFRALLILLATALVCTAGHAAEPLRLRVLTYNIHHGEGTDGRFDLDRIAGVIKGLRPDLVALQEVDNKTRRASGVDQAAELGKRTGMHVVFGKAMDYAGGEYGEAVLSRFPFTSSKNHALPFTPGREPRAAIEVRVRPVEDGPEIRFIGTHLEHADEALRLAQAQRLNELFAGGDPSPTILAGDLNAVPGSPPMKALLEHFQPADPKAPKPTFPSETPRRKIDYVLLRPPNAWRVTTCQVPEEPVASDHAPLLAEVELKDSGKPGGR